MSMTTTTRAARTTTTTLRRTALVLALLAAAAAGASSCGGVTDERVAARDKATKAACDRYDTCELIGPNMGQAYVTYDSCTTVWRSNFEQMWPASTCRQINQQMLNVCLSAIAATNCMGFDFVGTLLKCQAQDICLGVADAGSQG